MSQLALLKAAIEKALPDVDLVLAWRQGLEPLRTVPALVKSAQDLDELTWGPLCVNNLSSQLMHNRGKKLGIVVKGCDSRSIVQLMQEGLVNRESLVIFGMPCTGVVDLKKVAQAVDIDRVSEAKVDGGQLTLTIDGKTQTLAVADVMADKCMVCKHPNPVVYDHLIGSPVDPAPVKELPQYEAFKAMNVAERFEYWKSQMERCVRCYACRNSCPMCFCRDVCLADSRIPHWQSQETSVREKWMFQMVHALHLAGRCTECGECERACPVGIPLMNIKREMSGIIKDLFNYEAGIDPNAAVPLMTFQVVEERIKETEW